MYNSPLDIWAMGAIMAELYTSRPLFPGSSESDQLYKICSVVGTPSATQWPEGHRLAGKINFKFPRFSATDLGTLVPQASQDALNLMNGTMQWDPNNRFSAQRCLQHAYFATISIPNGAEQPVSSGLPQLPRPTSKSEISRAVDKYANPARPPSGARAKPDLPPVQAQPNQWAGNFLMNNLNSSKGRDANGGRGSGSGSDARSSKMPNMPGAAANRALPPLYDVHGAGGLPPLGGAQKENPGSGTGSRGSSRYLRMARYQPGMQQTPVVASAANMRLPGLCR